MEQKPPQLIQRAPAGMPSPDAVAAAIAKANPHQNRINRMNFLSGELQRLHETIRVKVQMRESYFSDEKKLEEVRDLFLSENKEYYEATDGKKEDSGSQAQ